MLTLKHIDVLPTAKIAAVIYGIIGIIIGVFLFIITSVFAGVVGGTRGWVLFGTGAASIIIIPIVLFIVGFIFAVIGAWLYNVLADRLGGIKVDIKRNRLKRIDPLSIGKIYAVGGAIVGFIVGLVVSIVTAAASVVFGPLALLGIASIVIFPILFGVLFFVFACIFAWLYNYVASKIGGVMLWFKARELKRIGALSYAKIEGVLGAIIGFVEGVIHALISILVYAAFLPVAGLGLGLLAIVAWPVFYLIISFVAALFSAWLYNKLVPKIGGVRVTLK